MIYEGHLKALRPTVNSYFEEFQTTDDTKELEHCWMKCINFERDHIEK